MGDDLTLLTLKDKGPMMKIFKHSAIFLAILCGQSVLVHSAQAAASIPCYSGPCDWPVAASNTLSFASDSADKFEPSGLTTLGGDLYIASDNGKIAKVSMAANNNTGNKIDYQDMTGISTNTLVDTDFESMTNVAGTLFVGVEGDSSTITPTVYEYLPNPDPNNGNRLPKGTATNIGRSWVLTGLPHNSSAGGMEAMTFVPDGKHPFPNSTGGFHGVFLAASQADKKLIHAYDFQQNGTVKKMGVIEYPVLGTAAISELSYSSDTDTLYVLYDESDYKLQEIRMTPPTGNAPYGAVVQLFVSQPLSPASTVLQGIEGLVYSGNDLFIAVDQKQNEAEHNGNCTDQNNTCNNKSFNNIVYRYLTYPKH